MPIRDIIIRDKPAQDISESSSSLLKCNITFYNLFSKFKVPKNLIMSKSNSEIISGFTASHIINMGQKEKKKTRRRR